MYDGAGAATKIKGKVAWILPPTRDHDGWQYSVFFFVVLLSLTVFHQGLYPEDVSCCTE